MHSKLKVIMGDQDISDTVKPFTVEPSAPPTAGSGWLRSWPELTRKSYSVEQITAGLLDLSSALAQGAADYEYFLMQLQVYYGVSRETLEPRMIAYAASVPYGFKQINWQRWINENVCCHVSFLDKRRAREALAEWRAADLARIAAMPHRRPAPHRRSNPGHAASHRRPK